MKCETWNSQLQKYYMNVDVVQKSISTYYYTYYY